MLKISQLYLYPIKSLAGISVDSAVVTITGFEHDRKYMLVDENNRFLTIREFPKMTRLKPKLEKNGLSVVSLDDKTDNLFIPYQNRIEKSEKVIIWNSEVEAHIISKKSNAWFSELLGANVKLVYMPQSSRRPVDTNSGYKPAGKFVSFADAYPFMMMGEASLTDLNKRYNKNNKFGVQRFRPNIVFSGGIPNQEDKIERFSINNIEFQGLENCARCTVPNVDPQTGILDVNSEPLTTLSKYRIQNRKTYFGRNLVHSGTGKLRIGDILKLG
ncbi:MOSC domain-containing protein [Aurantibacter crassamenti]|uniref:MOSC domain-containing protein n=1 Tax=Aurantibacter crassamenti TaxID=1837375 RepID=UPI00193A4F0E|nr:MOSC N-terminal beta barrel domain-containing protein [Aurantibacter crassamenti]MBM1105058.1 MOSC domain-containing protein [Aurantibacter crassamenti]